MFSKSVSFKQSSWTSRFATAALGMLLATVSTGAVLAAGANAQITGNGFSPATIKVISENGASWTKIEDRPINLPVTIHIHMDNFVIKSYEVKQAGQPAGQNMEFIPTNNLDEVNTSITPTGFTQNMTAAERQGVINACNARLNEGAGIHESHNLFTGVGVVLAVSFLEKGLGPYANVGGIGPAHETNGSVTVPVLCEGVKERAPAPGGVTSVTPDFKVKDINLRFMTSAAYVTQPDPATRCKLTQVRVRVGTTKAGPTKFKLWTKIGNGPAQSEVVDAWSSFAGPGRFEATFMKPLPVTKTTTVQAKAEDMVNAIGLSTDWKSVTVHCTGAGGGGLAGTPTNANPDNSLPRPPQVRPPFNGRPGVLVDRPHPTHDSVPPRGLGNFRATAQSSFAAERFQRAKVHAR